MSLRFVTAGESHGPGLTAIVEGLPAGLELRPEDIDADLARRQLGHGRGGRMKIEKDRAEVTAGVRHGRTLGSPVALRIENRDYAELGGADEPVAGRRGGGRGPPAPARARRPRRDPEVRPHRRAQRARARERARDGRPGGRRRRSPRRSCARSGWRCAQHVHPHRRGCRAGAATRWRPSDFEGVDESPVRCLDADASAGDGRRDRRRPEGQRVARRRCSRCIAFGLVPGIGSHVSWEERLDGRLAQAIMSIQAHEGRGRSATASTLAERVGSKAHDEIFWSDEQGYYRETNRAGGIEGGMTTGDPLVVRGAMKPLPTLTKPLRSVDIETKEPAQALRERTDSCTVPAAGVVGEAMVALVLAGAYREKFGGDHMDDVRAALAAYRGARSAGARGIAARARGLHGRRQVHRRPLARRRARRRAARLRPRAGAAARRADRVVLRPGGRGRVPRARGGGSCSSCSRARTRAVVALGGGALRLRARARGARARTRWCTSRSSPRTRGGARRARAGRSRATAAASTSSTATARRCTSRWPTRVLPPGRPRRACGARCRRCRAARVRAARARGSSGRRAASGDYPVFLGPRADRVRVLPPRRRAQVRGHRRDGGARAAVRGRRADRR